MARRARGRLTITVKKSSLKIPFTIEEAKGDGAKFLPLLRTAAAPQSAGPIKRGGTFTAIAGEKGQS